MTNIDWITLENYFTLSMHIYTTLKPKKFI